MAADQDVPVDQLPEGHTPVWIEPPQGTSQVEMLERVKTMAGQYQDVMVLYNNVDGTGAAAAWCRKRGWKYLNDDMIYGCEAQCVVLLDRGLWCPQFLTRARNMLIILKNR